MVKSNREELKGNLIGFTGLGIIALIIWGIVSLCSNPEKDAIELVRNKGEIAYSRRYLQEYPKGKYVQEVKDTIFSHVHRLDFSTYGYFRDFDFFDEIRVGLVNRLIDINEPIMWEKYLNVVSPADSTAVLDLYHEAISTAYSNTVERSSLQGWLHFIDIVPQNERKDSEERIHRILSDSCSNNVSLLVFSFPYNSKPYTVSVHNSDFSRNKTFKYTNSNHRDSLYIPYGRYSVEVSAPNTVRYSEILNIQSPREWIPLTSRMVTYKK